MLGFIGRHWRGEANFWLTFVLALLLPLLVTLATRLWLGQYTIDHAPYADIAACAIVAALIAIVAIWQLVAMWRASSKASAPDRWLLTRWFARLVAVAGLGIAAAIVVKTGSEISGLYEQAKDRDVLGQQPHDVSVDDDRVIVTGTMSWGAYYAFVDALDQNPNIKTVVLNSLGGHYAVGLLMENLIRSRGLDTVTTELCASACTFAFLGGKQRILGQKGRLGYHAPWGNVAIVLERVSEHMAEGLRSVGASEDFIKRVFATPGESVWFPTHAELRQTNIVTDFE